MPSIPYTKDTPVATNNPSQDVNNLTQNTNSVSDILDIDHKTFTNTLAGRHRQVSMTNQGNPGLNSNDGVLYCDNVRADGIGWPVWANAVGGLSQIELISFPVTLSQNGVVPLAGKMIMQFGRVTTTSSDATYNYNTPFPNAAFIVTATPTNSLTLAANNQSYSLSVSNSTNKVDFRLITGSNIPVGTVFNWIAIGY